MGPDGDLGGLRPGEDGPARAALSETAQATEQVLESCRRELQLLRRWLRGRGAGEYSVDEGSGKHESGGQDGEEPRLNPGEKARSIAERLEACARALRNASTEKGE